MKSRFLSIVALTAILGGQALAQGAPDLPGPDASQPIPNDPHADAAAPAVPRDIRPSLQTQRADVNTTLRGVARSSHDRVIYRMERPAPGQPKVPVAVLAPVPAPPPSAAPEASTQRSGFLFFPPLADSILGYGVAGDDVFTHDPTLRRDPQPSDLREGMPGQPGIGHRAYENLTGVNGAPKYIYDQGRSFDERCGLLYRRFYDYSGNSIDRPVPVCN